jgi:hypothetical protein|tara:strand:- start:4897 stop:5343 length:447 start_codon:yes stop_codon:yes gene_type:complete
MILISHRGNINGSNPENENKPGYIFDALSKGYNVEVDIWGVGDDLYLGHDKPMYKVHVPFISDDRIWCHCKNIDAITKIREINDKFNYSIHYFWHQEDDITLTSKGFIWAYPGKQPIKDSIAVMPEIYKDNLDICKGVCSDDIEKYKL